MDKWALCLTVLLAVCAANISADDDYTNDEYEDYEEGPITENKQEDQITINDHKIVGSDILKSKDHVVADRQEWADNNDDDDDHIEYGEDFELRSDDNVNEEQKPSVYGLADDKIDDTEGQNGNEQITDDDINVNKHNAQTIDEGINSNSEENADKRIFEAIRQSFDEDTDIQNEGKLDEDYQIEDNRAQVQNKFDEENGDEPLDDVMQNSNLLRNNEDEADIILGYNQEPVFEENYNHNVDKNTTMEESEEINVREDSGELLILQDIFDPEAKSNIDKKENLFDNADSEKKDNYESEEKMPLDNIYETSNEALDDQNFGDDKENSEQSEEIDAERKVVEESFLDDIITSDEDTVNKVYDDLKGDLDELFETVGKLVENDSDDISDEQQFEEENSDGIDVEVIKNASPDDEDRHEAPEKTQDELEVEEQDFDDSGEERILKTRQDYYDSMKDYKFDDVSDGFDDDIIDYDQKENGDQNDKKINENKETELDIPNEEFVKSDKGEEIENYQLNKEKIDEEANKVIEKKPVPLVHLNDGLLNENSSEQQNEKTTQTLEKTYEAVKTDVLDHPPSAKPDIEEQKDETADLTSAEVNNRMIQFAIDHSDDLDVNSKNFDRDVAPVYITLKVGEAVVIESPNYPNVYPANNIVDWIIDGEGVGIEMNVTDLAVNGILGDYLLVKPGGIDESGTDGLIFSYQLRSERRYRFLDINRMFIRFQSQPGMSLLGNRGFQLRLALLNPLSEAQEPVPEPEAILQPPRHMLKVYLGGVTRRQLANNSEEFRMIVADMATLYINRMGVEVEDINTTEVTQITRVATCNVNWPGFERCAGVLFGVPLADDEESGLTEDQLRDMWSSYVDVDPFAARLRRMGVTEFVIPNDRSTLLIWLVIGAGVTISAAMLALALWRWSCFEDYTRMPAFSDTDSVIGDHKRNLDLYPTPHQTLPPLYDDDFVKYEDTARVDMGGFTNKSFAREGELLHFESDDDLGVMPVKRDRSSHIQPKDIYQV